MPLKSTVLDSVSYSFQISGSRTCSVNSTRVPPPLPLPPACVFVTWCSQMKSLRFLIIQKLISSLGTRNCCRVCLKVGLGFSAQDLGRVLCCLAIKTGEQRCRDPSQRNNRGGRGMAAWQSSSVLLGIAAQQYIWLPFVLNSFPCIFLFSHSLPHVLSRRERTSKPQDNRSQDSTPFPGLTTHLQVYNAPFPSHGPPLFLIQFLIWKIHHLTTQVHFNNNTSLNSKNNAS